MTAAPTIANLILRSPTLLPCRIQYRASLPGLRYLHIARLTCNRPLLSKIPHVNTKMAASPSQKPNAHSYTTAPAGAPAVPRPSASLILLSPQNEILLTHRTSNLSFANAHVFPGGNLDTSQDPSPQFCAIRETFEETGILLTNPPPPASLFPSLPSIRKRIHARDLKFTTFLSENNLKADVDSLIPYTTWITPPTMKKRYHTSMFLGFLPLNSSVKGQGEGGEEVQMTLPTSDGGVETVSTAFLSGEDILAQMKREEIILFPPQAYLVSRLVKWTGDRGLSLQEQRDGIVEWLTNGEEGVGGFVFEPRPEGRTKDGRVVLGYGPRGDTKRKTVVKFGKGGMPAQLEIVGVEEVEGLLEKKEGKGKEGAKL